MQSLLCKYDIKPELAGIEQDESYNNESAAIGEVYAALSDKPFICVHLNVLHFWGCIFPFIRSVLLWSSLDLQFSIALKKF